MKTSTVKTVSTVRDLRTILLEWRSAGQTVALVPTMGALHRGHLTLVQEAQKLAQRVVVSIFVNPLQFAPTEDLAKYPRQLERDQQLLLDNKCDLLFAPTPGDMYPVGFSTTLDPGAIAVPLEGTCRPGHFAGVATIVTKLLMQSMPDYALFGEKDYQQLQVIRRITRDLDIPPQIIGIPTVREEDGLALSSRNAYLTAEERQRAVMLPHTLQNAKSKIMEGHPIEPILQEARQSLTAAGFRVDYFELAHASTLVPVRTLDNPARLLTAARLGNTRLIDNIAVNY